MKRSAALAVFAILVLEAGAAIFAAEASPPQYEQGNILIPASRPDEAKRTAFSAALADDYLRQGALAWERGRSCVSCHTTGTYMVTRPALAPWLGRPLDEMRDFFVRQLREKQKVEHSKLLKGNGPAQVIYIAAGLAEWDRDVTGRLSPETGEALALMFDLQDAAGTWPSNDCWPPLESDSFHLATQAAMAAAAAPGWLPSLRSLACRGGAVNAAPPVFVPLDAGVRRAVSWSLSRRQSLDASFDAANFGSARSAARNSESAGWAKLTAYLRTAPPPHDYGRTLLLWAADRIPDLLPRAQKQDLIAMLWRQQRPDGGWSIRTFAAPEAWGRGNRAKKLRQEPEFSDPPSDGHQTGLVLIVLREAGIPADDARIRRGVRWLEENQRASGRWWTRSLNTDKYQFVNYSGTAYPLLALALCGELPEAGGSRPVRAGGL